MMLFVSAGVALLAAGGGISSANSIPDSISLGQGEFHGLSWEAAIFRKGKDVCTGNWDETWGGPELALDNGGFMCWVGAPGPKPGKVGLSMGSGDYSIWVISVVTVPSATEVVLHRRFGRTTTIPLVPIHLANVPERAAGAIGGPTRFTQIKWSVARA